MASGALVLKKFQIDHSGMTGTHVNVAARQPGFMAFILNLMGLDPTAAIQVTAGSITFRQSSIRGMSQATAALTSVGTFLGGYSKPIGYLMFATVAFVGMLGIGIAVDTVGIMSIVGLVIALVCVVMYIFNKEMYIGFETAGGATHILTFKQAVIEGVTVNIQRVEEAIQLVNDLINQAASGKDLNRSLSMSNVGSSGTIRVAAAAPAPMAAPAPAPAPMAAPMAAPAPAPAPAPMAAPAPAPAPAPSGGPPRPGGNGPFNQ